MGCHKIKSLSCCHFETLIKAVVVGKLTGQLLNKRYATPVLYQATQKRKIVLPSCKKLSLLISIFYYECHLANLD